MKVRSTQEAWNTADGIFPTDYEYDTERSNRAGYPIYHSTAEGVNAWISDLTDRLEVNLQDGRTVNIWIEQEEQEEQEEVVVETEKDVHVRLETIARKAGAEVTVKAETSVMFGKDTHFSDVLRFQADIKKIYSRAVKAIKAGDSFTLQITEAKYRQTGNLLKGGKFETLSFDCWEAVPVYEQDTEGIYFRPDTRYTAEHRDLYLTKANLLEDLAGALE